MHGFIKTPTQPQPQTPSQKPIKPITAWEPTSVPNNHHHHHSNSQFPIPNPNPTKPFITIPSQISILYPNPFRIEYHSSSSSTFEKRLYLAPRKKFSVRKSKRYYDFNSPRLSISLSWYISDFQFSDHNLHTTVPIYLVSYNNLRKKQTIMLLISSPYRVPGQLYLQQSPPPDSETNR